MAVSVDPPQRGSSEGRAGDRAKDRTATSAEDQAATTAPSAPGKLAEPPIPGGRVEALMGRLIRVLSHSPLARPLPAVTLSALGLAGVAFVGLCATAPHSSADTPPVLLPLTDLARNLGTPHLPDVVADTLMYVSLLLCCLGLAMMLWANSHGWTPSPRKVFAAGAATVAVLVNITPVGSGDVASYAAYGRIAALGLNPYTVTPIGLPGGAHNPYAALVNPLWRTTPSVYGPVSTWMQMLAAYLAGERAWLAVWILMMMAGAAFLGAGYVLLRTAANPVRACLLWVANPILLVELVLGGHLDALLALVAISAITLARRRVSFANDALIGCLAGVAVAVKVTAALLALGIAIQLLHDRAWARLARAATAAVVTTAALYLLTWGIGALKPLAGESKFVLSPSVWRLIQEIVLHVWGLHAQNEAATVFSFAWPPLTLALAWYLYNRLSPDVPTVLAATCALWFAWVIVAPWSLPWYASIAWVTLALLPRNSLTRWLTIVTGGLSLLHFNGGFPTNPKVGPTP
ncbi:MAG: polyprenol phosphomannose-dependent alpha 1,6 mannosyltransferase MptB [Nocardiopsaceae bacterium]|nr:polyprenol phosphomannose-dependent alpha 1,6 mannosyltransferase MptB [Nocardiopsaceae bacterium]